MEIILELLFELLIQVVGQALFEMGMHVVAEPFRKSPNPWVAAVGYVILGIILGGITLWLFPLYMVKSQMLRWVNLAVTPVIAGLCMCWLGSWRERKGQLLLRIDRFSYGYLFAATVGIVRFVWGG